MASAHVAHNCVVGDHVIFANGVLLAGHVEVADQAFLSGNCVVHQFCRIGTLAIAQGGSVVSQDLPPYTMMHGLNELCGLNIVGLRRAGLTAGQRLELKRLYRELFRSGKNLRAAVEAARQEFTSLMAKNMLDFIAGTKRGVCSDRGGSATGGEEN